MLENSFTFVGKVVSRNIKKNLPKTIKGKKTTISFFSFILEVSGAQGKVFNVEIKTMDKVADFAYGIISQGTFIKVNGIIDIKGKREPKVTFIGTTVYRLDINGTLESNERDYYDLVESLDIDFVEP